MQFAASCLLSTSVVTRRPGSFVNSLIQKALSRYPKMGLYRPVAAFKHLLPLLCTGLFLVQFAYTLSDVPSIKPLQDIICKNQYNFVQSDVLMPESACSGEAVQRRLTIISVGMAVAATTAGMSSGSSRM